jgi:hypothetical protein
MSASAAADEAAVLVLAIAPFGTLALVAVFPVPGWVHALKSRVLTEVIAKISRILLIRAPVFEKRCSPPRKHNVRCINKRPSLDFWFWKC